MQQLHVTACNDATTPRRRPRPSFKAKTITGKPSTVEAALESEEVLTRTAEMQD